MFKQYTLLFFLTMLSAPCIAMESIAQDVQEKDTSQTIIPQLMESIAVQAPNIQELHTIIDDLRRSTSPHLSDSHENTLLNEAELKSVLSTYIENFEASHLSDALFSPEQKQLIVVCLMLIMQKKVADLNEYEQRLVTLLSEHQDTVAKLSEIIDLTGNFESTRIQLLTLLELALKYDYWPPVELSLSCTKTDEEILKAISIIEEYYNQPEQTYKETYIRLIITACSRMHDQGQAALIKSKFIRIPPYGGDSASTGASEQGSLQAVLQTAARMVPANNALSQDMLNGNITTMEQLVRSLQQVETSDAFTSQDDNIPYETRLLNALGLGPIAYMAAFMSKSSDFSSFK